MRRSPDRHVPADVLEHATPRERELLAAAARHPNDTDAAAEMGVRTSQISKARCRARQRAELARLEHEAPQPEGQRVTGVSTLYELPQPDEQGRRLRWVKTSARRETVLELAEVAREVLEGLPAVAAVPPPAPTLAASELATVYAFGDPHFGMYADARETGDADYDTKIAARLHRGAIDQLVARTPPAARGVLLSIGDTMHADGRQWTTARSGHVLDGDGRVSTVYRELVASLAYMADRLLGAHEAVDVVIVPGNHDDLAAHTLAEALRQRYRDEPRIDIADFHGGRFHFAEHGACLLGFYHGDGARAKLRDFGELAHGHRAWSSARLRHGYTGHVHSAALHTGRGWTAESLPTLAPGDAWSVENGYRSQRSAKADVYHTAGRRVCTWQVTPEEIERA